MAAGSAADPHRRAADVAAALGEHAASVAARLTRTEPELRQALEEADGRRVVLVGGDGTLHAAVNAGIALPEVALIPAGRANNVARALGIPKDLAGAARIAAGAPARPLDLLLVETQARVIYAVEALSAGLQAEARGAYAAENSGDLRAGARALAGALRRYRPYEVHLRVDGQWLHRGAAAQVFLSNFPLFGPGFPVAPDADPADGLLEALVLPAPSRRAAGRLLLSTWRGRHLRRRGAKVRRAARAVLATPLPLACDGTPLGVGTASVTVEPGKLRIAAPWRP